MIISDLINLKQNLTALNLAKSGRILALDVGSKRIGIAICDDQRIIATPKVIIERQSNLIDFKKILLILQETQAKLIVIGIPLDSGDNFVEKLPNQLNKMSEFIMRFAKNFEQFLHNNFENSTINNLAISKNSNSPIPLVLFDERYSSFSARMINHQSLKHHKKVKYYDDVSASLILDHFLQYLHQSLD